MSSPVYSASMSESLHQRPATISELAARAQEQLWDPTKGLKHWLRTAEKARKNGDRYAEQMDYERAFVEFARAATIVLEKLPTHRDYNALLNADQRQNLGMNGQDILDSLSQLKPLLVERYEQWQATRSATPNSSRPSTTGSNYGDINREEASRRRREEMQEERTRHALEAARWEQDWQRDEQSRRHTEEMERQAREESAWARQQMLESRQREEQAAAAERRAAQAKAMAEQERQAQRARLDEEARKEEEDRRRAQEEGRRREREGILRRQQEAEATALAARMEVAARLTPSPNDNRSGEESSTRSDSRAFSVVAPQPAHAPNASQMYGMVNGLPMPLESPIRNDDDSSTDVEGIDRQTWYHHRHTDHTPSKSRQFPGITYPHPVTTTSPAPPEGPIRYPTLMSQHQLKQGYVPSLRSMFSKPPATQPSGNADSTLLIFDSKPSEPQLHSSSVSDSVFPPMPSHLSVANGLGRRGSITYPQSGRRGPSPSGARPAKDPPTRTSSTSRIVPSTSTDSIVQELKTVRLPRSCLPRFLSIARVNTLHNRETCGLLLGKDKGSKFVVTTLLIPKQRSTSDTCTMDEEELVLQFTEERHLITLGWIHTHPTQSCFMSSVDLHTHSGFQRMLPESFAVVCAPTSSPTFGIFRLTDPGGLQVILDCTAKEAFHPHPEVPIYTDCDNSHVQMKEMELEIVDLR